MNFLVILLTASLIMSLIMLALLGLSSLSRQTLNAQTRYFMWVILLVGLVIPFRPLLGDGLIKIQNPISLTESVTPSENAGIKEAPTADKTERPTITDQKEEQSSAVLAQPSAPERKISLATILFTVWAIGAIVLFAKYMMEYRRFHRIIKRWGKPVTDPFTLETFEWVKARMGLENEKIGLVSVSTVSTPMLTGLFKPVILLPEKPIEDDEMELILEHELTHYKHKDLLINLIGVIALCIHWFNPILYLCMPAIYGDGESYCDETVLKNKDLDYRRFYGEVIISMIEASPQKQIALSTCFYAKKLNIKRRLFNIMENHGKRKKLSISSVTLILCLTIVSGSVIVFADPGKRTIGMEKAKDIALDDAGFRKEDVSFYKATMNDSNNKLYDVEFEKDNVKYKYEIDARTGQIAGKGDSKTAVPEPNASVAENKASISAEQAKQIALRHAKVNADQAGIVRVKLSSDQNVYDVEFYSKDAEYDYQIDAKTGEILKQDRDIEGFEIPSGSSGQENTNSATKSEDKTKDTSTSSGTSQATAPSQNNVSDNTDKGTVEKDKDNDSDKNDNDKNDNDKNDSDDDDDDDHDIDDDKDDDVDKD